MFVLNCIALTILVTLVFTKDFHDVERRKRAAPSDAPWKTFVAQNLQFGDHDFYSTLFVEVQKSVPRSFVYGKYYRIPFAKLTALP
ncbi:unnamed protein product [Haemonchus placei]|uniref:Secreted protein n=1 Tax=Haemonchus placei TaxID=6290 RepID=A0A0N4WS64_HAEPC|nr:unnamed protein product [Haemonchus placei]